MREVGADSLRACALAAAGAVAAAAGESDTARLRYEDAVDLFQPNGAPFETAHARIELARVLAALGRHDAAAEQARTAHAAMLTMRGEWEAEGAAALRRELAEAAEPEGAASVLTPREVEVLRLVAQGLGNPAIAERLVLSEHTVHRP